MLNTIQYNGKAHPILAKMYATKLWEERYGSIRQMSNPETLTMTQMLYYVYCCVCNGYYYQKEPIPFDFDDFLCNTDMEDSQSLIEQVGQLAGSKKK